MTVIAKRKPKAAAPKKPGGFVESEIVDRNAHPIDQLLINIHGPASSGKTIAALTASDYWPKSGLPNKGKPIMLRDVLHKGWDAGALAGAAANKISVAYAINVPSLLARGRKSGKPIAADVMEAHDIISEQVGEIIAKDPNVRYTIDDTISRMDRYLVAYWSHADNIPVSYDERGDEKEDTRGMYRKIFFHHHQYQAACVALPADVISFFLFHCKVIGEENERAKSKEARDQKRRTNVIRLQADVSIVPQITGQGLDLYTNDASVEFACLPVRGPKGTKVERRLWTVPSQEYRTKNRFQDVLEDCEPADMGRILQKIRAACA